MTQYFRLCTRDGRELACDMSIELVAGRPAVVIESRSGALSSGAARNPDYNEALELLLDRVAERACDVLEITLESKPAQALPVEARRLPLEWPLGLRPSVDTRQLRLIIADGQRAVASSPTKPIGTGNANRRIRLVIGGVLTASDLAAVLHPVSRDPVSLSNPPEDTAAVVVHEWRGPVLPWLAPGAPVLPTLLRRALPDGVLPSGLTELLPLDVTSPWTSRFPEAWSAPESIQFNNAFAEVLAIGNPYKRVVSEGQVATLQGLSMADVGHLYESMPLRQRTRNVLFREYGESTQVFHGLANTSFGQLMGMRNFGAMSFFDLMVCVDQVLESSDGTVALPAAGQGWAPTRLPAEAVVEPSVPKILVWQEVGSPVLPRVLRRCLPGGALPASLLASLPVNPASPWESRFLEADDNAAPLFPVAFSDLQNESNRRELFLSRAQADCIAHLSLTEAAAVFERLPLRARTRNALLRCFGGAEGVLHGLAEATVGDIFDIRHFGAVSFFDLATCLDQVLEGGGSFDIAYRSAEPSMAGVNDDEMLSEAPHVPDYADVIRRDDRRFGDLFDDDSDTLERYLQRGARDKRRWSWLQQVVFEVDARCELRGGQRIEDEAADILSGALGQGRERWLPVFVRRLGLDGSDPGTLDEAAALVGVTRERVRQVQTRLERSLPQGKVWAPAVDQCLDLLAVMTPTTTAELDAALVAAGLTRRDSWSARALVALAKLSGRTLDLEQDGEWIGAAAELEHVNKIRTAARAVSGFLGVATPAHVAVRLQESGEGTVESGLVAAMLERDPAVHRLSSGSFWMDHASGRNRLVNVSLRILSVLEPQSLEDMHEGVARAFAWRASTGGERFKSLIAPEISVLSEFYVDHPAFHVLEDDCITAVSTLPLDSLGPEKAIMVELLRAQEPPVMDRNSLIAACVGAGMSSGTAGVLITYGEFIKRYGPNVWGLRGARVSDRQVAEVQAEAKARTTQIDATRIVGRTATGRPWFARRVTPSFLYSGVMSNDWERHTLDGARLEVVDGLDGESVGQLRFSGSFNYGYAAWLKKNDVKVGDVIRVTVDLNVNQCIVELGDEELLAEPFDW
ncbi:hypothetical protein [Blastococcus sp. SYSU D00813]